MLLTSSLDLRQVVFPGGLAELPELILVLFLPVHVASHGRDRHVTIDGEEAAELLRYIELVLLCGSLIIRFAFVDGFEEILEARRTVDRVVDILVVRLFYFLKLARITDLLNLRDRFTDLLISHNSSKFCRLSFCFASNDLFLLL